MNKYYYKNTAPMKWHSFTSYFRTPLSCLVEIYYFCANMYYLVTNTYPNATGFVIIDCIVSLSNAVIFGVAVYGLVKYRKLGLYMYFISYAIMLLYQVYVLIVASSYGLYETFNEAKYAIPAIIIFAALELLYYYKRYPLFGVESSRVSSDEEHRSDNRLYCRYCGSQIGLDATFCRHCGAELAPNEKWQTVASSESRDVELQQDISANQVTDSATELRKFKQLLDEGLITQEDYDLKKEQILSKY